MKVHIHVLVWIVTITTAVALLKYCNTFSLRSTFSEFAMKYGKDNRFKGIEKMKDRESLFTEFMAELKKKEKESVKLKQDKVGSFVPLGRHVRGTCSLLGGGGEASVARALEKAASEITMYHEGEMKGSELTLVGKYANVFVQNRMLGEQ